jgi:hypothetical protein
MRKFVDLSRFSRKRRKGSERGVSGPFIGGLGVRRGLGFQVGEEIDGWGLLIAW